MRSREDIVKSIIASFKKGINQHESADREKDLARLEQDAINNTLQDHEYIIGRLKTSDVTPIKAKPDSKHMIFDGSDNVHKFAIIICNLPYGTDPSADYRKVIQVADSSQKTLTGEKLSTILIQGKELQSYIDAALVAEKRNVETRAAEAAREKEAAKHAENEHQNQMRAQKMAVKREAETRNKEFTRLEKLFTDRDPAEIKAKEHIDRLVNIITQVEMSYRPSDKEKLDAVRQLKRSLVRSERDPMSYEDILAGFIRWHDRDIQEHQQRQQHYVASRSSATSYLFLEIDAFLAQRVVSQADYKSVIGRLNTTMEGLVKRYKLDPNEAPIKEAESKKNSEEKESPADIAKQKYKDVKIIKQDLESMSKKHLLLQTLDYSMLKDSLHTLSQNMPRTDRFGAIGAAFAMFKSDPTQSQSGKEIRAIETDVESKGRNMPGFGKK